MAYRIPYPKQQMVSLGKRRAQTGKTWSGGVRRMFLNGRREGSHLRGKKERHYYAAEKGKKRCDPADFPLARNVSMTGTLDRSDR